jgi:hypothetical protein
VSREPSSLRIVVTGLIAQYPLGGVTWDYLQYVLGLAGLGHDVFYIEDTMQWPYNPAEDGVSKGCDFNVQYLSDVMHRFGFEDSWAYKFPWQAEWFGMSDSRRNEVLGSADMLINVSGSLAAPVEYRDIPLLVYIDSDPVFTQAKLARGQNDFRALVDEHDVHFSFGERINETGPSTGHNWIPTRQPVVLSEWRPLDDATRAEFTTIMNWTSYKPVVHDGQVYGQKDVELRRFFDLPQRAQDVPFELALAAGKTARAPYDLLRHKGWRVVDPAVVCPDLDRYRGYVQASRAEWSVAKGGYVTGSPGWFSCRSACYLASGRPVVVQDTGLDGVLPTGRGLLTFTDLDEALHAVHECVAHYDEHSRAASEIAAEYFDSDRVLEALLAQAMVEA